MALIGNTFVQPTDPGAVGFGYNWYDSGNGNLWVRSADNTAWNALGNANTSDLGNVPVTGANMTGALTGVTGWAPVDSPNFTTAASLEGVELATQNDLATLQQNMENLINNQVSSALASYAQSTNGLLSSSISILTGTLDFSGTSGPSAIPPAQTIPLPSFTQVGGGTISATENQCKWFVSAGAEEFIPTGLSSGGQDYTRAIFTVDPLTSRTFACYDQETFGSHTTYGAKVFYVIIAIRG
jgi:hypothetical protein